MPDPHPPEVLLEAARFRVERLQVPTSQGPLVTKDFVRHPGAVAIIPFVERDRVCLVRNRRPAVNAVLIELPAGTLEPDEDPLATAQRELGEETGYRAAVWHSLGQLWMSPGILSERMHLFVAEDLTPGEAARELGEEIENLVVPFGDAIEMVERGEIEDAKSVAGLLLYERRLRRPNY